MPDIVMSIKARHIRSMKKGLKRYELRKSRPGKSGEYRVWLCECGSGGRIVASFTCLSFPELTELSDRKIAKLGKVTEEEVRGYRGNGRLYGWRIHDFQLRNLHITDFGLSRPPQSWCYAKGGASNG